MCSIASTPLTASSNAPSYLQRPHQPLIFHGKRSKILYFRDVFNNGKFKLVTIFVEELRKVLSSSCRSDGASYRIALVKEFLAEPDGNIAISPGDQNFSRVDCGHDVWVNAVGWVVGTVFWT